MYKVSNFYNLRFAVRLENDSYMTDFARPKLWYRKLKLSQNMADGGVNPST